MITKARYFAADSREAAEEQALTYFERGRSGIVFEVVKDGTEDSDWLLFAYMGSADALSDMSAGYGLFYEEDGVWLELYKERGAGSSLDITALTVYIGKKNISGLDEFTFRTLAQKRSGRSKIASAQKEFFLGEDISVSIASDEMEAKAKLIAPEPGGAKLEIEAAVQKVAQAGVTHGLNANTIREMLDAGEYNIERIVAVSIPPENGADGVLTWHFMTDEKTARPKEIEGGRVDYKQLDLYEPVSEGQVLVTRTLATEGTPGFTVKGRELKQKRGKDVAFPRGKNVDIDPDKTKMTAKASGLVEFVNGSVNVSNIYKVEGDVGPAVGNIDFDGSVQISGNVLTGHVIKATGGIFIGGVVEASEINAGGNVEVRRGMQGMDKGNITAGGAISILYIERGKAAAGGSITVDASIHSVLEAGESLYAKGKRGSIIGGRAAAAGEIVATSLGSVSHAQTEIEVGVVPRKRERYAFLEKEVEKITGEITKLDQQDAYLEKTKGKLDIDTWDKLHRSLAESRRSNGEQLEEYQTEMDDLKRELEEATNGKVHVYETVYPGVRITIASDAYKVNDDIEYATFKFREGQITYTACEMKKG